MMTPTTTSSDPRTKNHVGKSYEETYESINKFSGHDCNNAIKAQKLPPCPTRKAREPTSLNSTEPSSKSTDSLPPPSLPPGIKPDDVEEEEIEFSMGKLIRQASLNHSPKPLKKQGPIISPILQFDIDSADSKRMRPQRVISQLTMQKSLSAIECHELQNYKNSGFNFNSRDSNLEGGLVNVANEEKMMRGEKDRERKLTRTQSWAPAVAVKRSLKEEDLKAQIKFWARAVASNVNPQ